MAASPLDGAAQAGARYLQLSHRYLERPAVSMLREFFMSYVLWFKSFILFNSPYFSPNYVRFILNP